MKQAPLSLSSSKSIFFFFLRYNRLCCNVILWRATARKQSSFPFITAAFPKSGNDNGLVSFIKRLPSPSTINYSTALLHSSPFSSLADSSESILIPLTFLLTTLNWKWPTEQSGPFSFSFFNVTRSALLFSPLHCTYSFFLGRKRVIKAIRGFPGPECKGESSSS